MGVNFLLDLNLIFYLDFFLLEWSSFTPMMSGICFAVVLEGGLGGNSERSTLESELSSSCSST